MYKNEELTYLSFKEMIRIPQPDIIEERIYTKYTQVIFHKTQPWAIRVRTVVSKNLQRPGGPSFGLRPNIHSSENSRIPAFEAEGVRRRTSRLQKRVNKTTYC